MSKEYGYRPTKLADYQGQPRVKKMLGIYMQASKMKNQPLEHCLISGFSGSGKSTIAKIIASEMNCNMKTYLCSSLKTVDDILDIFGNVEQNDMIFLDEIQQLKQKLQGALLHILESFTIDVNIEGEIVKQEIPRITVIAATTNLAALSMPVRNRFPIHVQLEKYTDDMMAKIVTNALKAQNVDVDYECAHIIGSVSRGVPRIANNYARSVADYAMVVNNGKITKEVVLDCLDMLGLNKYGLTVDDMSYLTYLYNARKSVSLATLSMALGTDTKSVEQVIEPYLFSLGIVAKSMRGRNITNKGVKIMKELSEN